MQETDALEETPVATEATSTRFEPLFADEFPISPEEQMQADSTMAIDRKLWAYKSLDRQIGELEVQRREASLFYERRIEALERRQNMIKLACRGYLDFVGKTKIATPQGTVYTTTVDRVILPEHDILIDWATEKGLIRTSVDLAAVKAYLKENPLQALEGYRHEETTDIRFRLR